MRCYAAGPWPHSALTTLLLTGRSRRVSPRRAVAGCRPVPRCPLCSGSASPPGGAAPPPRPPAAARCAPRSRCSVPPVSAGPGCPSMPPAAAPAAPGGRSTGGAGMAACAPRPRSATAPPGTAGAVERGGARAEGPGSGGEAGAGVPGGPRSQAWLRAAGGGGRLRSRGLGRARCAPQLPRPGA